uniref:Uncharacterized protein n=1 Tax=Lactuca sativa TaxID=4236 RepID=A0A9R1VBY4_LACSA|nr:hypothetical protein LSAT_V11C500298010 [Lactuca sativa]
MFTNEGFGPLARLKVDTCFSIFSSPLSFGSFTQVETCIINIMLLLLPSFILNITIVYRYQRHRHQTSFPCSTSRDVFFRHLFAIIAYYQLPDVGI